MECDYLYGWIKNGHIRKEFQQKMMNPRDIAGNAEEAEIGKWKENVFICIKTPDLFWPASMLLPPQSKSVFGKFQPDLFC